MKDEGNELPWIGARVDQIMCVRVYIPSAQPGGDPLVAGLLVSGDICTHASYPLEGLVGSHREFLRSQFSKWGYKAVIVQNPYAGLYGAQPE